MGLPKYIGSVHPEEYIREMRAYCNLKKITDEKEIVKFSIMKVDSSIDIPSKIESCEDLVKELRDHVTYKILKNSCIRKLHLLKYKLEREGGDTPKFINNFSSLCRDAEINDIERQKNYLYYALPNDFFRSEFIKRFEEINSMDELIVCFENTLNEYSKFILNGSVVALKHVTTGKYLCSNNKHYVTGSKNQMVFCGQSLRDSNSAWTMRCFNSPELLPYGSVVYLQHVNTNTYLEICTDRHNKSPVSGFTEVSCGANNNYSDYTWVLDRRNPDSKEDFLKTHDIVILKNKYPDYLTNQQKEEVLRSHGVDFTLGEDKFQEIFTHSIEDVNDNDEWCIEHIE